MAFQTSDGQSRTNRPAAKMHDSYVKRHSGAQLQSPPSEDQEMGAHEEMATCPNCGHQFQAHEEQAEEQVHPGIHDEIQHLG